MLRSLGAGLLIVAGAGGCTTVYDLPDERVGETTLRLSNGTPVGTVQLLRQGNEVSLAAAVAGMEPGTHGFHLHETGKCAAPDFSSAGGHLNPGAKAHGSMSASGKHLGDLPNLEIGSNRSGTARIDLPGLADDVLEDIFDADGTAIVVHANPDDYRTDPSGNAGARIACGVIEVP